MGAESLITKFNSDGKENLLRIYERHHVLTDFLVSIGVDETVADRMPAELSMLSARTVFGNRNSLQTGET